MTGQRESLRQRIENTDMKVGEEINTFTFSIIFPHIRGVGKHLPF